MTVEGRLRWLALSAIFVSLLVALADPSVAVKPDEPLYGAIAEGMWLRHDPVIPMFQHVPAWYKPPLLYWLGMAMIALAGPSTLALRLVSVGCGLLLLWATFRLARRLFDTETAWTSLFILGTSLGFVEYSRAFMMDLPLAWLYVEACDRLWVALVERRRTAWIALGAWAGLACLLKGPVVVLIILVGALVFSAWQRVWDAWHGPSIAAGLAVGLLLALFWPALVYQRGLWDEFYNGFILRENLGKFSEAHDSGLVLWSSLLLQLLPWTFISLWALSRFRRERPAGYLVIMALAVVGIYLLPQRKLPHYVLPAVPLMLVYTAACLKTVRLVPRWIHSLTVVYCLLVASLCAAAWRLAPQHVNQIGLVLAVAGMGTAAWAIPRRRGLAFVALACFWSGYALAQDALTTTLDPGALRQVVGPSAQVCGMEVGMAVNDVVTPMPLAAIQWAPRLYREGTTMVIRRRDAVGLPYRPDEVVYHWWRWKDGLAMGDILQTLRTGDTGPLLEEILVIRPAAGAPAP